MAEAREEIRRGQREGWFVYEIANLCGLDSRIFGTSPQWGGPPGGSPRSGDPVRDPVVFAAWLWERLTREEEIRARRIELDGPGAVAGGRSRGLNREALRRAVKLWEEEAVRWVAMEAARFHTGPSGGARLWQATVAEVERWVATRSPGERSALLTLWRVSGGGGEAHGPVVQLMARSGVWRRASARAREATPPPEEPPATPPGPSVPAHPTPPPPPP